MENEKRSMEMSNKHELDKLENQLNYQMQLFQQKENAYIQLDKENKAILAKVSKLEAAEQGMK